MVTNTALLTTVYEQWLADIICDDDYFTFMNIMKKAHKAESVTMPVPQHLLYIAELIHVDSTNPPTESVH